MIIELLSTHSVHAQLDTKTRLVRITEKDQDNPDGVPKMIIHLPMIDIMRMTTMCVGHLASLVEEQ